MSGGRGKAVLYGALTVLALAVGVGCILDGLRLAALINFAVAGLAIQGVMDGFREWRRDRAKDGATEAEIVARWQKTRDRIYRRARRRIRWNHSIRGAEGVRMVNDRVREQYDAAAGDARARGEWVPTIEQLRAQPEGDNPWRP